MDVQEIPKHEGKFKLPSELNRIRVLTRPLAIRNYLRNHEVKKFHLGCGPNYKEGWLNADKFDSRADIYFNGHLAFPFREDTFQYIYSEHTLEHIRMRKVKFFLSESLRILKPGGVFRISVPDLELFARKYTEKDEAFFAHYMKEYADLRKAGKEKYWLVRSPGGVLNTLATRHFFHHRWFYDFETLQSCALELGYSKVDRRSFANSPVETLGAMDRQIRESESLYIELTK